jgi:5-methyltetrahydrofolate--homocysteine methyltransferase
LAEEIHAGAKNFDLTVAVKTALKQTAFMRSKRRRSSMKNFKSWINHYPYVLADGAMGTRLFASGLEHGDAPERWTIEHPQKVSDIHQAYLEAGSQILLTNTFGGNRLRLALRGLDRRVNELNRTAAGLLKEVIAASGKEVLAAGDIGPSGGMLQPYGELSYEDAVSAFAEQAAGLIEGGVDLIWIETMADLEEVRAAVEGVRQVSAEIPLITTMTFDTRGRTMMGVTPEKAAKTLAEYGVAALGGNCGNGPDEIIEVIRKMHAVHPEAILVAKANAGMPMLVDGRPVYRATPKDMAGYAVQAFEAGARIIGACCGSTPEHILAIAGALRDM